MSRCAGVSVGSGNDQWVVTAAAVPLLKKVQLRRQSSAHGPGYWNILSPADARELGYALLTAADDAEGVTHPSPAPREPRKRDGKGRYS